MKGNKFVMSIKSINVLSDSLASKISNNFLSKKFKEIAYRDKGDIVDGFDDVLNHIGLYAFVIVKGDSSGISYVGKTENEDRLRQHLTGKNKDGTLLKNSVATKYKDIKESINNGYNVYLSLYANNDFNKSSLSCIEIACIQKGIKQLASIFPDEKTWNKRI